MGTCVSKIREDLYVRRFAPDHDQHSFTLSRNIERQLRRQEQEDRSMIKLLLLGSGNSGKSTVMKQFKIIHKRGFTAEERRVFRDALWKSAIESMRSLVRARQDYVSAAHLGDPDAYMAGEDGRQSDRDLVDPSMEPYFQFLLFRVRNDQHMHEEVIIPVAAEPSPRAECLSPAKNEVKQPVTQVTAEPVRDGVVSPLLTSTTIVLSSPPVTERKSPLENGGDAGSESSRSGSRDSHRGVIPPVTLDGQPPQAEGNEENGATLVESASSAFSSEDQPREQKKKKKRSKNRRVEDEEDEEKKQQNGMLGELNNGAALDASTFDETALVDPAAGLDELKDDFPTSEETETKKAENKVDKMKNGKSSTKRIFATYEEEAEYLARKERSRRHKKKKREKSRRKQLEDLDTSFSGRSGGKKMLSASSVESFRSDISRGNAGQKVTAPMVTWEKMTVGRLLQKVWMDPLIQRMWALEEKSPQLEAPLGYIMNAMDRIAEEGFQPTNEDILFARKRTSGVNFLDFEAYGAKFLLIDVGGQRTERKKWLAHFDIVDAVIFVVGLDQYDQVMMEDGITNRLRDSLELFEEMCSSPWFRNSSFLLFLNKSDVFKTKIKQVPLTVCFRNYQGDPHDYDATSKYIIKRFQQIHSTHASNYRDAQPNRHRRAVANRATPHVYPYMTNATDTEAMRFVIDTCQDILLRSEMEKWGFFDF